MISLQKILSAGRFDPLIRLARRSPISVMRVTWWLVMGMTLAVIGGT